MPSTSYSLLNYLRTVVDSWRDDPRDDATLLARFAEDGDETAFRVLVGRHGPMVWQTCRRILGDTPDAEDTFQTTFLALAHKAGRFPVASLAGWLHRVARRTVLDVRAGVRRRRGLEQRLRAVTQPVAEEEASRAELYAVLDEELAGLPERLRVPLVLRYLEGKTLAEVAQILGCSLTPVTKRLARGEAILRRRLERRGMAMGAVAALLTSSVTVSAMPVRLIGGTARAAVAFRSGALTGGTAEAAWAAVRVLPVEAIMMRKIGWMALACVGLLGAGLAAWQAPASRSDEVEAAALEAPQVVAGPSTGQVDRFGDPLPPGALARLGTLRLRHVGGLLSFSSGPELVVFSRDGKVLITTGPTSPIRLWDAATGKLLRSFGESHPNPAVSIALSPDGRILASRNADHSVSLWQVATGKRLRQLGTNIHALAFSRDGRTLLSAGQDNHIRVWEVATGKELRDQPLLNADKKAGELSFSIFSPDGKVLASIHNPKDNTNKKIDNRNNIVYLWETASGKELRHLSLGRGVIPQGAAAFSPDSRFLAVNNHTTRNDGELDDAVLQLWEVATSKEVRKWTTDKTWMRSVAFSPDGKVLATGSGLVGRPLRLWEAATGKELRRCQGYGAHVVALAFSPDSSTLASVGDVQDHTVRLWEVASGKERLRTSGGHVGPVVSVSFSPDGKSLISGGMDGLVGLWNAETGQQEHPPLRAGDIQALTTLSADGKTVLSVGNSFSPNIQGLFDALTDMPTQVCVWDRATGQKLRQFQGPVGTSQSLTLSSDRKILVLTSRHNVSLMEAATGKVMRRFPHSSGEAKLAALSPDDKTLAVYLSGAVHFYETDTGKDLGSIKPHPNASCLAFSPDGRTLAVGGVEDVRNNVNTIHLWHVRTNKQGWKETGTLVGHRGIIRELMFSPDGKTLASASNDGTARLWEVATGKERRRFAGHGGEVWCVAFTPDGRRLATGCNDTTILVWDVTGRLQGGQLPPVKLSTRELKSLWADLAGADAVRAGQAVWVLTAAPAQTFPLLKEHFRPVVFSLGPRIARLIADLDKDNFTVRQKATDELEKLGEFAEPALRQALAKATSLEMRRRLEQLLEQLERNFPLSGEPLRTLRAMEVLGQLGTPEAMQLLEALTQAASRTRRTQ